MNSRRFEEEIDRDEDAEEMVCLSALFLNSLALLCGGNRLNLTISSFGFNRDN